VQFQPQYFAAKIAAPLCAYTKAGSQRQAGLPSILKGECFFGVAKS
jgi:hypothetical protein